MSEKKSKQASNRTKPGLTEDQTLAGADVELKSIRKRFKTSRAEGSDESTANDDTGGQGSLNRSYICCSAE